LTLLLKRYINDKVHPDDPNISGSAALYYMVAIAVVH
jgi:hypothetical protein